MRSATYHPSVSTARADALFASALQPSSEPSAAQIHRAIATAERTFGTRGCAAQVAQAFGEHPGDRGAADALGPRGGRRRVRRRSSALASTPAHAGREPMAA